MYTCMHVLVFTLYLYNRLSRNGAFSRLCVRHMCNVVWGQANSNANAQYKLSMHMYVRMHVCVCVHVGVLAKPITATGQAPELGPDPDPDTGPGFRHKERTALYVDSLLLLLPL